MSYPILGLFTFNQNKTETTTSTPGKNPKLICNLFNQHSTHKQLLLHPHTHTQTRITHTPRVPERKAQPLVP